MCTQVGRRPEWGDRVVRHRHQHAHVPRPVDRPLRQRAVAQMVSGEHSPGDQPGQPVNRGGEALPRSPGAPRQDAHDVQGLAVPRSRLCAIAAEDTESDVRHSQLRRPAKCAKRSSSAICNCSSQLQCAHLLRYATARHANRACCDLPFNRSPVMGLGAPAPSGSPAPVTCIKACQELTRPAWQPCRCVSRSAVLSVLSACWTPPGTSLCWFCIGCSGYGAPEERATGIEPA